MAKKVLIIEDEPDVMEYLNTVLENNGYRTYTSTDAENAFAMVKEIVPDLICLDIMMPRESGLSFYKRLKETKTLKNIPVVVVSGVIQQGEFDFRSFVPDETIAPPERYIEKPIVVDDFLDTVAELTASDRTG
ncbi:MAG: response regulator [candidate division Zixibacteria bacterium]|nr:response regulator [candidate division Zixibacteria bacterium]